MFEYSVLDVLEKTAIMSFDLIRGHWEYEKHAVMFGCSCKSLLREEYATHLQNGES